MLAVHCFYAALAVHAIIAGEIDDAGQAVDALNAARTTSFGPLSFTQFFSAHVSPAQLSSIRVPHPLGVSLGRTASCVHEDDGL